MIILLLSIVSLIFPEEIPTEVDGKQIGIVKEIDLNTSNQPIIKDEKIRDDLMPKIELIVDSSGSMGQLLGKEKTKMYYTKQILNKYLRYQWKRKALIGMRTYGSRRKNDCTDNFLAVEFGERNLPKIQKSIMNMSPIGMTPLNKSIEDAINDLKDYEGSKRIVIFTDGNETCGGDPCELVKKVRENKEVEIDFYVVAIGFDENSESYKEVECLGDTSQVNTPGQLTSALSKIDKQINTIKNIKVTSPKDNAQVRVYKWEDGKRKYYKSFIAENGTRLPHGIYDVEVILEPKYVFPRFQISPGQRKHLVVQGYGKLTVNFTSGLMDVQLLDKNMKVIHKLKSDKTYLAKTGEYKLKLSAPPYFSSIIPNFYIFPNGSHIHDVAQASAIIFQHKQTRGLYIYDSNDELVGRYITNAPLVLKSGTYRFHVSNKCSIPSLNIEAKKEIQTLTCPN